MYHKQQTHQQEQHQQTTRRPLSSSSLSLSCLLKLSYVEQWPQEHNNQDRQHHHSHHSNQHHRQRHKARNCFPRCGLILLILLSVIKDSLTTTYSTSYLSSLDVTTTTPQINFLPYFDFDVPRNITVTVGQTGFLHCRVERLGDKDVSWIRKRDLHILTAGSTTYTSDQRFQVLRPEKSGNWTLQIKYPQPRDSGIYECQINTEPKLSLSYTFNVVELKATIVGPTDLYVKSGSDINLTCKIIQGPHELGNIFWYKGSEMIDMTTNLNEIDSGTRITVENDWSDGLTSRLKIRRASSSDTGNYSCVPTIAKSSSVYVHVIIGEHPAAMQHNSSNRHWGNVYICLCCMLFTVLTCCLQHFMFMNSKIGSRAKTTTTTNLAPKRTLASRSSLSMGIPNATAITTTNTTQSAPRSKAKANNKITPSKQYISPSPSYTKTSPLSAIAFARSSTTTKAAVAAIAPTCGKTRLLVSNGRIAR